MGNPNRRFQGRQQQSNSHQDSDDPATRTTFYVTNFSDRVTGLKLREAFRSLVNVTDAWVPRKRSVKGRVFGFVRCEKIKDPYPILKDLNEIVIMDSRISVSLAMFDRSHRKINYGEEDVVKKTWIPKDKNIHMGEFPAMATVYGGTSGSKKTLQLNHGDATYPSHCCGRAVIGVSDSIARLHTVKKMLVRGGFKEAAVSYLGGLTVLISFRDSTEMNRFIGSKEDVWKDSLVNVSPWLGQSVPFERIVVLKVVGMPILARDGVAFDSVGRLFGDIVWPSDFSWIGLDNSIGFAHVLTKVSNRIDEEITVYWKNRPYSVWVVEENSGWVSEFEAVDSDVNDDDMEEGEFRHDATESPVVAGEGVIEPGNQDANFGNVPAVTDLPNLMHENPAPFSNSVGHGVYLDKDNNQQMDHSKPDSNPSNGPHGVETLGFQLGCSSNFKSRKRPRVVFSNSPEDSSDINQTGSFSAQSLSHQGIDLNDRLDEIAGGFQAETCSQVSGDTIVPQTAQESVDGTNPGMGNPVIDSADVVDEALAINSEADATVKVCSLVGIDLKNCVGTVTDEIIAENGVLNCQ